MKTENGQLTGGISKFFDDSLQKEIIKSSGMNDGDIIFLIGDERSIVEPALGALRVELARREGLTDPNMYKPVWVTSFPMFKFDEKEKRFMAMHHPFTAPRVEDIDKLESDPAAVLSRGYDLTLNGHEIADSVIGHPPLHRPLRKFGKRIVNRNRDVSPIRDRRDPPRLP